MPRKKKAAAATPESPKPPTCSICAVELTWRDLAYGGKAREATDDTPATGPTCKRCHAKAAKQTLHGTFSPLLFTSTQNGKPLNRLVTGNRATRRDRRQAPAPIADKPPKRTRAMRRQAARQKAQKVAQIAA